MYQLDLSRADLNLLVLFEAVLEERHVGRAADRLNLSASAVSHGLSRLRRLLNDPLFLKTPKGVVPTDRGLELAEPVATVLSQLRSILASAEPFDAASSRRRFSVGAPDGVSAVILAPLLASLRERGPGLDISLRQVLPASGETNMLRAWAPAFTELEARATDIAIIPSDEIPARFHWRTLYNEDFVIVARRGHRLEERPELQTYLDVEHVVVSMTGDPMGFVDHILAKDGKARRIALTLPNFMFALAVVADSDFVCAVPRHFAAMHAERLGIGILEAPFPMPAFRLNAVALHSAMRDSAISWLFDLLPGPDSLG